MTFPAVTRDADSAAFFDSAARGELLIKRCPNDATVLGPQARTCPSCASTNLEPFVARGVGRLVSWAVVHRSPLPALAGAVPYVTAIVELAEGPWLSVRLIGADPAALRVGDEVGVDFVRSGEETEPGEVLPVFRPR